MPKLTLTSMRIAAALLAAAAGAVASAPVSVVDFGAKGDDKADDTAAIQACINYAQTHPASCYVPPATYKITGAGLSITGSVSLRSDASVGMASAQLKYYGTGTALTIGDGTHWVYASELSNLTIIPADGVAAQYGINSRMLTESNWDGIMVGGSITTGRFLTEVRFQDSAILNLRRLIIAGRTGSPGSTGILFDDAQAPGGGNSHVVIDGGDFFYLSTIYDVHTCQLCSIRNVWHEAYDYAIVADNANGTVSVSDLAFDGNTFLATLGGDPFQAQKLIRVNAVAGKVYTLNRLQFTNNRVAMPYPGVTSPIVVRIDEQAGAATSCNLMVRGNTVSAANSSLIDSNSPLATLILDWNFAQDARLARPADASGTYTLYSAPSGGLPGGAGAGLTMPLGRTDPRRAAPANR